MSFAIRQADNRTQPSFEYLESNLVLPEGILSDLKGKNICHKDPA